MVDDFCYSFIGYLYLPSTQCFQQDYKGACICSGCVLLEILKSIIYPCFQVFTIIGVLCLNMALSIRMWLLERGQFQYFCTKLNVAQLCELFEQNVHATFLYFLYLNTIQDITLVK